MKYITEIAPIFLIIAAFGAVLYLVPAKDDADAALINVPAQTTQGKENVSWKTASPIDRRGALHRTP